MSQEKVEIVLQGFTESDVSQRRLPDFFPPDFVWETGTFRGAPGPSE